MTVFLIAFAVASLLTLFILHAASVEGHLCLDSDLAGPQKLHARPVPRVGGVGIAFGTLAAVLLMVWERADVGMPALVLLACAVPAFAAGLVEDLTKRVSPAKRLLCTAFAATLAAWLLGAVITRTDIPGLDLVAATPLGAMCLAIFVVSGVSNSINIIDGMNGLASMCSVIMLAGLSYVAFGVGDQLVMLSALAVIGAVLGFFMWNYPRGLIFLGDGGAYFVGFMLAQSAGIADLPADAVRVPDLRDAVLDVPPQGGARALGRPARRDPPAHADLQAADALGHRCGGRGGAHAAEFDDLALPLGAVLALGGAQRALVEQQRHSGGLVAGVRAFVPALVQPDRALQDTAHPGR
jgi:UDP-N-acetylmuramyl pentapeptide phosphotransferase/UDP-N-acetylglucosamine-1-phosphate transferase